MPDNVKQALAVALRRLLRPLIRIMLREGLTYPQFAMISRAAFIDCAARDFDVDQSTASSASISTLTGISETEIQSVRSRELVLKGEASGERNNFARVLHGWHNDRDYVGPYGFPIDLAFSGPAPSLSALVARHTPGISPEVILKELLRISAVREVGTNIWQPLFREYIDPTLSPENIKRMGKLVESLLATLENNTRHNRESTDLFERTMIVDQALSEKQLLEFQAYLKLVGGQFLQRVDAYAAIDLQEKVPLSAGESGTVSAGLQCFLFIEPSEDSPKN
jgi:hypothetical protein